MESNLVKAVEKYLDTQHRRQSAGLAGDTPPELAAVAQELAAELAYARQHHAGTAFRRLLVAVDVNPRAAWVLHAASALAQSLDSAELRLLHVVDPAHAVNNEYGVADEVLITRLREDGATLLRTLAADLPAPAEASVREGHPGEQIVAAARDWPADLILLAAPCHGQLVEMLTGSAAEYVMRHAPCPVTLIGHDLPRRENSEC